MNDCVKSDEKPSLEGAMRAAKIVIITVFAVVIVEVLAVEIFVRTHKFSAKEKPSWSNGVRLTGMPAWEGEDSPEEIWDLVSFIRHLPQLSPEELKEMKQIGGGEKMEQSDKVEEKHDKKADEQPSEGKPRTKTHKHPHEH